MRIANHLGDLSLVLEQELTQRPKVPTAAPSTLSPTSSKQSLEIWRATCIGKSSWLACKVLMAVTYNRRMRLKVFLQQKYSTCTVHSIWRADLQALCQYWAEGNESELTKNLYSREFTPSLLYSLQALVAFESKTETIILNLKAKHKYKRTIRLTPHAEKCIDYHNTHYTECFPLFTRHQDSCMF